MDSNVDLWTACERGDLDKARQAIEEKNAEPSYQDQKTGKSVLMVAAENGSVELVKYLLEKGAPWNALDRNGKCAGEYAIDGQHQDVIDTLVDAGVRAELVLGALEKKRMERAPPRNHEYLKNKVEYTQDGTKLVDNENDAVMMEWEKPLMKIHAEILCQGGGKDILNIGFGMGIVDRAIQEHNPKTHTIIEAHPDVHQRMLEQGWDKRPGVKIVFARWQDVINDLGKFDGIFFDTYGEYYSDLSEFHQFLPRILRSRGMYSFFNGLCPRNIFFHGVCCQLVQLELAKLGLETEFYPCQVHDDARNDSTWKGVKRKYWWNDTYYLPVAIMQANESAWT